MKSRSKQQAAYGLIGARTRVSDNPVVVVLVELDRLVPGKRENLRIGFSLKLGGAEVVLAAEHDDGRLEYFGRTEIVGELSKSDPHTLPWQRLTLSPGLGV